MSGCDFKLYRWGKPYWSAAYPAGELKRDRFEHTFTVPDGMWVMRQLYAQQPASKMLGHAEVLNLGREFLSGWEDTLLFGPEPFVVIRVIYGDDTDGGPIGVPHGAYLHRARQIHKSELGQFVPVELPLVAREAFAVRPWTNRDRRRGDGWVRLVEAAEMANLSIEQFVLDHWLFVEARDYPDAWKDVRIDMVYAPRREIIHKQVVDSAHKLRPTRREFEAMCSIDTDWSHYWIRRGFARTVLLLQRYGWNNSREKLLLGELQTA